MSQRLAQKVKTRQRIMDSAFALFNKQGIEATSTATIAKRAKLSHGALFVHFPDREALLQEVVDEYGSRLGRKLNATLSKEASVRGVLNAHLEVIAEYELFYRCLVLEAETLPKSVRGTLLMITNGLAHYLIPALEKDLGKHAFKNLSLPMVINGWIGLVNHYLINNDLFASKGSVIKKFKKEMVTHYESLLKVGTRRRK